MAEYLIEICFSPTRYRLHRDDCPDLPKAMVRDYFGLFNSDAEAVSRFDRRESHHFLCPTCLGTCTRKTVGKR